ncbi:MAG: hypothetical protein HKP59_00510 [Lutibacter sp.]|uniref:hypothetical protein n=1 Tax=Lutibacter sp. TaxID=1925666 RepID=UPI0018119AA5|nr:hypothetical protein [Lutibacter sp.]MBT8316086.1 hypothetical protein [Lutibacter sp.]NNJ56945.1 hypothetical protein [Lutibacter sp.]
MKKYKLLILSICLLAFQFSFSQGSPDYNGGFKVKFNEDGSKYLRIISWGQFQAIYNDNVPDNTNNVSFNVRRARVLTLSQITNKFLLVTHFGLNSLNSSTLHPVGKGDGAQLFMHDVWGEWSLSDSHAIGAGLHYWNGISRLNNQSTLNLLTLDNNRQSWATIGISDQFARHVGIYFKGKFGKKFKYQLAINDAITNGLDMRTPENGGSAVYGGKRILGSKDAGFAYAGYFEFNFLDGESNFLPYRVGTYLGTKKVFNVGAGFFAHPSGSVISTQTSELKGENVSIMAIDAFYDAPINDDGSAITAYATYQSNDYGKDYLYSAYGTGSMFYTHVGYVIKGDVTKSRFQPYLSFASNSYDAIADNRNVFGAGANLYLSGHNSKLTLEYKNEKFGATSTGTVALQAMIYL